MKVSKSVSEVANIILSLRRKLNREPTQNVILDKVLEIRGDKGCSATTVGKARRYLDESKIFSDLSDDICTELGRDVLRMVTERIPSEGGLVALAVEINSLRAQLQVKRDQAKYASDRLIELRIDDQLVLETLEAIRN